MRWGEIGYHKDRASFFKKLVGIASCFVMVIATAPGEVRANNTLVKISRTGEFVVGVRDKFLPVGYRNEKGDWVGLGLDIAREIHKKLEENMGKTIKLTFLPVAPWTRTPMLVDGNVDIVCDTTAHTLRRDEVVDFSITWLVSGARLLTDIGSRIREAKDLAEKKVGAIQKSSCERVIRDLIDTGVIKPPAHVMVFPDHSRGFAALRRGIIDAYCADERVLATIKAHASNSSRWKVIGRLLTRDFYGLMTRQNDSNFLDFVNFVLIDLIRSGKFFEIYARWHGPRGVVPLPMNYETQLLLKLQSWPY
ncbi:MAG: transporter substrate-binding domain-containing protein [Deltaproteobacteria bacterium]|nr:transporter substrate-binding domain-containing protein [Deltaproteobacteria bacterium]